MCFPVLWFSVGYELWNKLIKEQHSLKSIAKQLMTYIVTLIIVPLFVYLTVFKIHFDIVPNSGDHDFSLSTHLKYSLEGNNFDPTQPSKLIAYLFLYS
jgi:dolichyl-phosphate-mannose--protein O-mannosyl transferase